jgi:hypothetical protein
VDGHDFFLSLLHSVLWYFFLSAALGITKHASAQVMVAAGLIDVLWIWLLAHWLRKKQKTGFADASKDSVARSA